MPILNSLAENQPTLDDYNKTLDRSFFLKIEILNSFSKRNIKSVVEKQIIDDRAQVKIVHPKKLFLIDW